MMRIRNLATCPGLGHLLAVWFLILGLCVPGRAEDLDRDSIDDQQEYVLAKSFLPKIWYRSDEPCQEPGVILYHVRPFVPGGALEDGIAITYTIAYYEDCKLFHDHPLDRESFALTLYPYDSPSGYGLYAITPARHLDTLCEGTRTYVVEDAGHLIPDPGFEPGEQHSFWGEIYVADGSHANYYLDSVCDAGCGGTDDCNADKIMWHGILVDDDVGLGQAFDLFNIGEINDPFLTNMQDLGEGFQSAGIWGRSATRGLMLASTGRSPVPVDLDFHPIPSNPSRECSDVDILFDVGYRSLITYRIEQIGGIPDWQTEYPFWPGEFCPGEEIRSRAWDGTDNEGLCVGNSSSHFLMSLKSRTGGLEDSFAEVTRAFSRGGASLPRPAAPTGLTTTLTDGGVLLTWVDHASDEDGFVVERRLVPPSGAFTCAYRNVFDTVVPDVTTFTDTAVPCGAEVGYRVYAYTSGGYSDPSTASEMQVTTPLPNLFLDVIEQQDPHVHRLEWEFDYPDSASFSDYLVTYRWKVPYGGAEAGPSGRWSDWDLLLNTGDIHDRSYVHQDDIFDGRCYEYRVTAEVVAPGCGFVEDLARVDHGHDCGPPPPPPGGCPVLFTSDGLLFGRENNILASSETDSGIAADYLRIENPLAERAGIYPLLIREDRGDHSYLDQLELRAVDRPENPPLTIGVTRNGQVLGFGAVTPPLRATLTSEAEGPHRFVGGGEGRIDVLPGDDLILDFGAPDGTILAVSVEHPDDPEKAAGPVVFFDSHTLREGGGPQWTRVGAMPPRIADGLRLFDLAGCRDGTGCLRIKLSFRAAETIDMVGVAKDASSRLQVRRLPLKRAIHSTDGVVTSLLDARDGRFAELFPGEQLNLYYAGPEVRPGDERSFVFTAVGYYVPY